MTTIARSSLVPWLLATAASAALAQTQVYRCGPDGRTYSQQPCEGGTTFDASDPRDAAQRAQARQVAAAQQRLATSLERERLAQEKKHRGGALAVRLDARRADSPAAAASRPAPRKPRNKAPIAAPENDDAGFTARTVVSPVRPAP